MIKDSVSLRAAVSRRRSHLALAGGMVLLVVLLAWRELAMPTPVPAPTPAPSPVPIAAEIPLPAPAEPAPPPSPAPAPPDEPPDEQPLPPPPLPVVNVAIRPVREVPPDKTPPRPDSTSFAETAKPSFGSGSHPSEGTVAPPPKQFAGPARVTGPTSLSVAGIPVQLFGVKPPGPNDRCEAGGLAILCADLAQKRLLERFSRSDQVSCRTPNPRPGLVVAFAICLDVNGIDLGSFLLNEGLALADTGQSYDYVGAEGIARTLKHGLWKFRR